MTDTNINFNKRKLESLKPSTKPTWYYAQNLLVRSQALYPIELQALTGFLPKYVCYLKRLSVQFYAIINFLLNIFLKLLFAPKLWLSITLQLRTLDPFIVGRVAKYSKSLFLFQKVLKYYCFF